MYGSDRTNTTVNVNFEDCLSEFHKRHVYQQKALDQLNHHKLLCLTYEEVVRDLDNSFRKLQEFLGVTVQPISVVSLKKKVLSYVRSDSELRRVAREILCYTMETSFQRVIIIEKHSVLMIVFCIHIGASLQARIATT